MTDHLRSSHQHFFTWRHQHQHSRPTHFSHLHSNLATTTTHNLSPAVVYKHISTPLTSPSPFDPSQASPRKTNQPKAFFSSQPPLSISPFDRHTTARSKTRSSSSLTSIRGRDLRGACRLQGSDEPDHELVIGYNCPGLTLR